MKLTRKKFLELENKIKALEEERKHQKKLRELFENTERKLAESLDISNDLSERVSAIRVMVDMPELYLDNDWRIMGHSIHFASMTKKVVEFKDRRKHLSEFLQQGDFEKINRYLEKVKALSDLPYEKGRSWELKYSGPNPSEEIGHDWIAFKSTEKNFWSLRTEDGKTKIYHGEHIEDGEDCYLMSAGEYGGADEDIKIVCKVKTSGNEDCIRDLSLVLSGGSGREEIFPDSLGYTACSGSISNTVAKLQRQAYTVYTFPEKLATDTEYLITVERCGGRIRRFLKNLRTGKQADLLELIDSNAIYDRENHIGFTTYSGEAEICDIQIYTRKSEFSIDQFIIPFNVEVGIRDKAVEDRIYKLRIGINTLRGKVMNSLLFEDITERKRVQRELERSKEELRNLSAYLQTVREEERARIAREIHDELGQVLTALKMDLAWLGLKIDTSKHPLVEKTKLMTRIVDSSIKTVQRITGELRPGLLDELGLVAAIEWEAEQFEKRTGITCKIRFDTEDIVLDWHLSTNLFRICQEALTNITRHAGATRVEVSLKEDPGGRLVLKVADNGIGLPREKTTDPKSFGLIGIRERAYFLGGSVDFKGIRNQGTTVTVTIPLNEADR